MKKFNSILATALLAALTVGSLHAADKMKMGKPVTVEGTLIDSKCFGMMASNSGQDHQTPKGLMPKCAAACATQGIPVAVLQKNGEVIIISAPAAVFAPHMAKQVRLTGIVPFKGTIIPDKVEAKSASGKWEEVKIATMM